MTGLRAFLSTSLGRGILIGLAILVVGWLIWDRGRAAGRDECHQAQLQAALEAAQRDRAAAAALAITNQRALEAANAENATNQERIQAYEQQIETAGAGVCRADAGAVELLLGVH